ncbi:AbiJ-NTD4 domain-containing protein [Kiloniella majae]|uniref:AbiJ-NTD4 domain-containing protein n=1 Tax=Kiloniella majae TaxID=1938558 RepID=UPI000F79F4A9|nr:hypothetical protein [Kiloniella majae]
MTNIDQIDRTKVTFSQAEGLEPLPSPIALKKLGKQARSLIWGRIYNSLYEYRVVLEDEFYNEQEYIGAPWEQMLCKKHIAIDCLPADEFVTDFNAHVDMLKELIFEGEYNYVFDFLTFILRHDDCPYDLLSKIQLALKQSRSAYSIIDTGPTVIPNATEEEGWIIEEAFNVTKENDFDGAGKHLRKAAEALNRGDNSDSVRESIHAVESVACRLNEDASKTLGPALTTLEKNITIHPALKKGFLSIYGYTSDQEGIRHAIHTGKVEVDVTDAVFMFGACASFVTYLINKARLSGMISN